MSKERFLAKQKEIEQLQLKIQINPARIQSHLRQNKISSNKVSPVSNIHQINESVEQSSSNHTRLGSVQDLEMMDVGTQVYAVTRDPRTERLRRQRLR